MTKNSTKILKWNRDFLDFRYKYALLQKIKVVCTHKVHFLFSAEVCTYNGNPGNPVSVSGFLLKIHRLISNVDFACYLLLVTCQAMQVRNSSNSFTFLTLSPPLHSSDTVQPQF